MPSQDSDGLNSAMSPTSHAEIERQEKHINVIEDELSPKK